MFWTAFIWGVGVSCGATCGLMLFVICLSTFNWITKTEAAKNLEEHNELALAALTHRNEISEESKSHLDRMAYALEAMYDVMGKRQ